MPGNRQNLQKKLWGFGWRARVEKKTPKMMQKEEEETKDNFCGAPWMSFSVITPFFVQSWLIQFYVSFLKSFGSCQLHQSESYTHT